MPPSFIIIGGGIAGLTLALALHKIANIPLPNITVHELRQIPQTIGGAVNLTPPAVRYLGMLGVLPHLIPKACEVPAIEIFSHRTGRKLAELDYNDVERFTYRAIRAKRSDILGPLTKTWLELGGRIKYSSKICAISEESDFVKANFEDGTCEKADFLIGCDGIHSEVRARYVQPERRPEYSGVAGAYGILQLEKDEEIGLPLLATSLMTSRRGSFLYSYCNSEKTELYVTAVMETEEVEGKEGWRVKGEDQVALKQEIGSRLGGEDGVGAAIQKLVDRVQEWYFFPVYKLPPRGRWSRGRVLLIGDAAHAMPPQGESMGIAIEDAVLLARLIAEQPDTSSSDTVSRYERNRTAKIDAAYEEANWRWENVKDAGYVKTLLKEYMTSAFLWWTKDRLNKNWEFDIMKAELAD